MKYTIHGFSQQQALSFKKTVSVKKGKIEVEKEIRIDCTDLLILRWFVDFYPKMMKVEIDGSQYAWVQYQKILQDLPLLDIKKQAMFDRLQKMCEFNILKHKTVKVNGTFSYYGFGEMYSSLIDTDCSQTDKGVYSTNEQIDSSIKDSSINDSSFKDIYQSSDDDICDSGLKEQKKLSEKMIDEEFETLWKLYPKKLKKKEARVYYKKVRKKEDIFEKVKAGIEKYNDYIRVKKIDDKYIAKGGNWFEGERWNDEYGEDNNGQNNGNNAEVEQPAWSGLWL